MYIKNQFGTLKAIQSDSKDQIYQNINNNKGQLFQVKDSRFHSKSVSFILDVSPFEGKSIRK